MGPSQGGCHRAGLMEAITGAGVLSHLTNLVFCKCRP